MVIAENEHRTGGVICLLQSMGINLLHSSAHCAALAALRDEASEQGTLERMDSPRHVNTWFAQSPARIIQGDEPQEEEEGNQERGGRAEEAKPAYVFSWHIPLGAEAAWMVVWQKPQVMSPSPLTLTPIGPLRPAIPCE